MLDPMEPEPATAKPRAKTSPKRKDRFAEINAFADVSMRELTRAEIAVWLLLWRDTKPNGLAKTSQVDLARRGGLSDRAVRSAITKLRKLGLLNVVAKGRTGRASTYRVRSTTKG